VKVSDYLELVEQSTYAGTSVLRRGLRSAREVDDQQDEQDDDEDPDQSIARSGECEQHGCPPSVVFGLRTPEHRGGPIAGSVHSSDTHCQSGLIARTASAVRAMDAADLVQRDPP
jgi:hypothetical protein